MKVTIFGVENDRAVLGLSIPQHGGKRYTVYTYSRVTEKFEGYPLDDVTEIFPKMPKEELAEANELRKMWWKGVIGSHEEKKQKMSE